MSASYNSIVTYSSGRKIIFPDFTIEYIRKDLKKIPNNANFSIIYYVFLLQCNGESKEIYWSGGTGMIFPTKFTCQDKKFHLEKVSADTFSWLDSNEIIITKQ